MPRRLLILLLTPLLAGCDLGGDDGGSGRAKAPPQIGSPGDAREIPEQIGFPAIATKNTTRVPTADPAGTAAAVASAVYPARTRSTRPQVVALVQGEDWRAAVSAAQLSSRPLRAPVLLADGDDLPDTTIAALEELKPLGAEKARGAQVLRIGAVPQVDDLKSTDVEGADPAALARAIDRVHASAAEGPSDAVIVASSEKPEYAMPAAGLAARSGAPVLWVTQNSVPAPTRQAIASRQQPSIYVLAPKNVVSDEVVKQLGRLGEVERVTGSDAVSHAIEVARHADGRFGWNVTDPGHGLVFANVERTADAPAAALLSASGTYGPLLLLDDSDAVPAALEGYLLDIQPGYDRDPVRGVYNRGWLLGDEETISVDVQARIDELLEIQPVSAPSS